MPIKTAHRPTTFDLGEARKSVVLSATEGEDKSIKFPDMFAHGNLMLLNKMDLLPYLNFDLESCIDYARSVNSRIDIMTVSAGIRAGMSAFTPGSKSVPLLHALFAR
jgi:hydrogenase nickel incorporation protein HypB